MPVAASPGVLGVGRAGARARPMSVRVAGVDWSSWVVVGGAWWRSGGRWLLPEASNQRACALVMPAREGEGKVRCELSLTVR
jgi:hypothetical protein